MVIPFTLCSLLLCHDMTGETCQAAQSPPPLLTGLPGEIAASRCLRLILPAYRGRAEATSL
ncbi:hypothetical protein ACVXG7_07150 [Enterobacter hormaechei]